MAILNEGAAQEFSHTGGMQSLVIPFDGLYKLEVWGAKGGGTYGGNGGYSVGYKELKKGTTIYICVGGAGSNVTYGKANGGYNGGGFAQCVSGSCGSGGGATHISLVSGTLASIGVTSFVTNKNGLIVAGGGGGWRNEYAGRGGNGGGTNGGAAAAVSGATAGGGGSQTAGGSGTRKGSFGQGGNGDYGGSNNNFDTGGGGGLYGGGAGYGAGAGGGSGYIDGVPAITYKGTEYSPSTQNGINSGAGKAIITFVKKGFPSMYIGDTPVNSLFMGNDAIDSIK